MLREDERDCGRIGRSRRKNVKSSTFLLQLVCEECCVTYYLNRSTAIDKVCGDDVRGNGFHPRGEEASMRTWSL